VHYGGRPAIRLLEICAQVCIASNGVAQLAQEPKAQCTHVKNILQAYAVEACQLLDKA
jgi:hypothetical protein